MKVVLLSVETVKEPWFLDLKDQYLKKIARFNPFEIVYVKSNARDRKEQDLKKQAECESLLSKIEDSDYLITFDEKGKSFNSIEFSKKTVAGFESGKKRLVLLVGGAYGVDENLRKRSNLIVSLSDMTMNHLVAQIVVLEQFYRALTIWKGVPYHNE